jgi:putative Mn2+ efflux pump MntP
MTTKSMIEDFAENKYFIGVVMITMNIGARFLIDELTPEQKKVLNSQNFRRFIVFCAFFAATRDILAAVTLTIIFILFVSEAFTDTEDMKNKKKKKITTTDIQNELNGLINKVKMMEMDKGENELKIN